LEKDLRGEQVPWFQTAGLGDAELDAQGNLWVSTRDGTGAAVAGSGMLMFEYVMEFAERVPATIAMRLFEVGFGTKCIDLPGEEAKNTAARGGKAITPLANPGAEPGVAQGYGLPPGYVLVRNKAP
jgi:hypothetical protein